MQEPARDPFLLPPDLWFGLLCEAIGQDPMGRFIFQSVFNQLAFLDPPANTNVPPNAFLNAFLVVGFSDGLGHFELQVELRDIHDRVLWQRPGGRYPFDLGPGGQNAAVLAEQVQYWFTQPGKYHFWIRVEPTGAAYKVQFQVARKIGPGMVVEEEQPGAPQ